MLERSAVNIPDLELDCVGHRCPIPTLRTRKFLDKLDNGQILRVLSSDPNSWVDIPSFCLEVGHELLSQTRQGDDLFAFIIRKRG